MAAVDYDRAWLALKAYLGTRRSHGTDDLRIKMVEIEVDCATPEQLEDEDMLQAATSGEHHEATSTSRPASAVPA